MSAFADSVAAAREGAAVFALPGRAVVVLTGGDRAAFLHNFCTNDIKRLQPGDGCEALVCNVKGRVLAQLQVACAADALWLDSVAGAAAGLVAHLDRYLIREDVQLHDRTAEFASCLVTGPEAARRLMEGWGAPAALSALALDGCLQFESAAAATVLARRVDWLQAPGFLCTTPASAAEGARAALVQAGATAGTPDAWDSLRIEAGYPEYGADISEDQLAQEVGRTERCISFRKGCYLGQEPIARLDALGHVNRELKRLRIEGPPPPAGSNLVDPKTGQDAGQITSAARAPAGDGAVALGYVRSKWTAAQTALQVVAGDARHPAVVR